jgi:hypothetical protein
MKEEVTALRFDSNTEPLTHRVTVRASGIPKKYEYMFFSDELKVVFFEDEKGNSIAEVEILSYEAELWEI